MAHLESYIPPQVEILSFTPKRHICSGRDDGRSREDDIAEFGFSFGIELPDDLFGENNGDGGIELPNDIWQ